MSVNRWLGGNAAVAQVVTLTVGSNTAAQTFITTINGHSITITADGVLTTAGIAAAIQTALAASLAPEFQEVTWTYPGTGAVVTGTAATPGIPFTVSVSGTGTYTLATPTASDGPNHVDKTGNWSLGALPAVTDDVIVDGGPDMLYGWNGISAAAYNSLRVLAAYTGKIGLPFRNETGGYIEYRTRAWPIASGVAVTIGEEDGTGPQRVNLNAATNLSLTIFKTGSRISQSIPVVNVYGSSAGSFTLVSGDLGLAADDDTTSITAASGTVDDGGTLTLGKGATVTTLSQDGGTVNSYGTITTLNIIDGTATLYVAPTTVTADGGTVDGRFTGTLATATLRGQGAGQAAPTLTFANDPRARTITNHTVTGGAALLDPDKTVTFTNAGTWDRASLGASDFGLRFSLQRT